jgi:hypothetical protein
LSTPVPLGERLSRRAWALTKATRRGIQAPLGSTETRALIVLGCQRSGTTMMVETLEKDWRIKTFHEYSALNLTAESRRPWSIRSASRFDIRLGPLDRVAATLSRSRFPLVVLKPLVESQHAGALVEGLDRSVGLWMFRNYRDVARSNVKLFGTDIHRVNLEPIVRRDPSNWRSERVPADVYDLVSRHYSPDMNPYDGGALFWFARNRLYFELGLDSLDRVALLRYEDLAAEPERWMRVVYGFAGVEFPGPELVADVHPRSVGLGSDLQLTPEIQAACERLWEQLSLATARTSSSPS